MKLTDVQVRLFRSILDSTDVPIQPDVTSLVGKNESGKTTFLHALYRLNPARPNVKFSVPQQYPAWREKKDRLSGRKLEEVEPIEATFDLDDADLAALRHAFGTDVMKDNVVVVSRNYAGRLLWDFDTDEAAVVKGVIDSLALPKAVAEGLSSVESFSRLTQAIDDLQADAENSDALQAAATLTQRVSAMLPSGDLETDVIEVLKKRLPKFFYYDVYSSLPAKVKIRALLAAKPSSLSDNDLTALALLKMAGAEDDYLLNPDYERRKRELENVANALTSDALKYWTQNPELRVMIDVSQENIPAPPPGGTQSVLDEMHIRMWDERHWLSLPLDERSTGFRWFFSFLAAFSQYEWSDEPIIILLDEPALGLHARAQKDFLRFINERLAARGRQVIYTTHSPFMIEPGRLERARLVEDHGRDKGSVVSTDIMATDPDTLFPLQGALGYDLAQHLFVHSNNAIVEGTSDFTYLTVISDFIAENPGTRQFLDPRWSIVPVGGADLVPTFVALLGHHLDLTVVLDARREGHQRLASLAKGGYLKDKRIITVNEVTGQKLGDIEDLFDVDDYLKLYNAAFGKNHTASTLAPGTDPIVSRIARTEGVDRFDHGRPADYLLRNRDKVLGALTAATLDNFSKLFARINVTLGT